MAAVHELTVWARDQAPRASVAYARVTVRVHDADEHAPEWGRRLWEARLARGAAPGALVAPLRAADRDAGDGARVQYALAGGDAAGLFTVDALGDVRLARALPASGPRDYTLHVRAANPPPSARASTLPLHVLVVEPDDAPPHFVEEEVVCEVYENEPAGTVLAALEARSASAVWYSLEGGAGLFALNPAAGVLSLAAPLDYEAGDFHNVTVTALNMVLIYWSSLITCKNYAFFHDFFFYRVAAVPKRIYLYTFWTATSFHRSYFVESIADAYQRSVKSAYFDCGYIVALIPF